MTINENDMQALRRDVDGLLTYEYIANHIDSLDAESLDGLVDNMISVDLSGQFTASAARYLHAIDAAAYQPSRRFDDRQGPRAPLSARHTQQHLWSGLC